MFRKSVRFIMVLGGVGILGIVLWTLLGNTGESFTVLGQSANSTAAGVDESGIKLQYSSPVTTYLYMPLVVRGFPPLPTQFGVVMHGVSSSRGLTYAIAADVYWVRLNDAFQWDRIEPTNTIPSEYHWDAVQSTDLQNAAESGFKVIAGFKFTPEWAQKYNGSYCGPIKEEFLAEFGEFVGAVVQRYRQSPYNVRYWELGNEPDVPVWYNHSGFGCWGEESDEYYGGGYYAEMLKVAYPAIKAADPQAQVLIGGLLLDCDPNDVDCSNPKPARFLEGILRNGGGDYFDIVSFHGYPPYDGSLQQDENFASWNERGGVGLGKIAYLREVMAKYGVDKPLIHTEGSLICPEWNISQCNPPDSAFYETQADYVVWLFVRNWAQGVLGTTWYQFEGPGWRYGSMLDANQDPKPAYDAYKFLTEELGEAVYVSELTQYADLRAYEFSAPGKRIWVLWAPDEQSHSISLPSTLNKAYDKYGNDITPAGDTMEINHPVYLELAP